jgi:hypothetical protein
LKSVTVFAALVEPTAILPNASDDGSAAVGTTPVPLNVNVSGLFVAEVFTVMELDAATPVAVGLNVTENWQELPAGNVAPQVVLEMAYGAVAVIVETLIAVVSLFDRVTLCAALVAPTTTFPKLIEPTESVDASVPVPVNVTVSGLFVPEVLTVMLRGATAPTAVGVSVTNTSQLVFAASVAPHVVLDTLYGAGAEIGETVIDAASLLVSENPRATLVLPTATFPKATVAGDTWFATTPVALNVTVVGLLLAELVIVKLAGCAPSDVGSTVIPI